MNVSRPQRRISLPSDDRLPDVLDTRVGGATRLGFWIYLIFIVSWFLRLGARVPALGQIRIDLILVAVLIALALLEASRRPSAPMPDIGKWIWALIICSVLSAPFVEWPGSVLRHGLEALTKAVVFFFFTVAFVTDESRLRKLITVFVACQLFRVMEPLYLHVTQGYWGTVATMANWEHLNRLSGAPLDIVNPNGLAFVICTALPFIWFLAGSSTLHRLALLVFLPACIYALMLTGSRTGFLGLIAIISVVTAKAKRRLALAVAFIVAALIGFPMLGADFQDRYLSIIGKGEKNEATAQLRVTGIQSNVEVALRRPLLGHGIGTSREANANFGEFDQLAHNLYAEVAIELGVVGLALFVALIVSIARCLRDCRRAYNGALYGTVRSRVVDAMQAWLMVNFIFSFFSYGVTSYEWYLMGGIAVVLWRLSPKTSPGSDGVRASRLALASSEERAA